MATVQNHIHLDTAIGAGPESAPTRTWKTIDREEEPIVFVNVRYTLGGTPRLHVVEDGGTPVVMHDFTYMIKIAATNSETTLQQKAALIALMGKRSYLVDHEHPDDGSSHSSYIRPVVVTKVGPFPRNVQNLSFYYVQVELRDLST